MNEQGAKPSRLVPNSVEQVGEAAFNLVNSLINHFLVEGMVSAECTFSTVAICCKFV